MCLSMAAAAQPSGDAGTIISLYPDGAPTSLGVPEIRGTDPMNGGLLIRNVSEPTLELFRPAADRANGTAVIVVPGGGFVGLSYEAVGTAVARRLVEHGVTALVLKHRTIRSGPDLMPMPEVHADEMEALVERIQTGLPVEVPPFAGEAHAVEDGARAMRIVRQRAAEWGVDPDRVGIVGFSSGAFLAADLAIGDPLTRPDFVALLYGGLRTPVPADASPAFIAGAADDEMLPHDPVQTYTAWREAGAESELHVYEHGGHGFDLAPRGTTSDQWFDDLVLWMRSRDLLK